jgi:hypothetical protein
LHLADHPAAAAVDAIPVAVEATVIAAVLAFEALAAVVTLGAVVALEALRTFKAFWPLGAILRALGRTVRSAIGTTIEALSAIVTSVVTAFDALEPFRTVVANDALVTLGAFEPFRPFCAFSSIDAFRSIGPIGSLGALDARRPIGSLRSFVTFGPFVTLGPFGERTSFGRQIYSIGPLAAVVYLIDASGVDAHGCVVGIGGGHGASATAGAWTHVARRLRG